ncbi:MAG: response regulator, partial [Chloroflexi bacterium]
MTRKTVLIVEDESIVALDLKQRLIRMGFDVLDIVSSAESALQAVARTTPDLIFLDIRLKGDVDGVKLGMQLRRSLGVPIIFLTAMTDSETMRRARAVRPAGFLIKPFD